ncbi:unnamed protein product [Phytophthora fragariaefolia]|uniref:Unnamed protein product n=1 Tax=Phytophthora fragariaefolia TaxID=1490495 RepID=A0A9W6YAW1_9STRA|nr:unnamed protein product [Phytophthora fragariaefolia]
MAVVQGVKQSAIHSHAYYFRADPSPPAGLLPHEDISTGTIGVTMVGCITLAQKAVMMKRYNARALRLLEHLQWYRDHNDLYKPLTVAAQTAVESFRVRLRSSWIAHVKPQGADTGPALVMAGRTVIMAFQKTTTWTQGDPQFLPGYPNISTNLGCAITNFSQVMQQFDQAIMMFSCNLSLPPSLILEWRTILT